MLFYGVSLLLLQLGAHQNVRSRTAPVSGHSIAGNALHCIATAVRVSFPALLTNARQQSVSDRTKRAVLLSSGFRVSWYRNCPVRARCLQFVLCQFSQLYGLLKIRSSHVKALLWCVGVELGLVSAEERLQLEANYTASFI
jgi:hypothetical protein